MEDLISQLTATSQEQQTVVKEYQNVNKALKKEQEKKVKVIKELGNELHKTKLASENSKVERGNNHSFQKKAENERQLVEANNAIKMLLYGSFSPILLPGVLMHLSLVQLC
jgi:valyl-tRNA synthetase